MSESLESYWDLLEPVLEQINIYEGSEVFFTSIEGMTRPQVLLYAAHMCQSEVRNGGFLQLFMNSTGILVPEAVEAFAVMGMKKTWATTAKAASLLGDVYPRDRTKRWDSLLAASGLDEQQRTHFLSMDYEYRHWLNATRGRSFQMIEHEFYVLIEEENGGFEAAATQYARHCA